LLKYSPAALLLSIALGCARTDIVSPTSSALQQVKHSLDYTEDGAQEAPEEVPESMRFPTYLHSVSADAAYAEGIAFGQSIVEYFATNALAKVTVRTNVGDASGESEYSHAFPANRSIMASAEYKMDACGGTIRTAAYGRVWNQFPYYASFLTWGGKTATKDASFTCPTESTPSRSGGDDREDGGVITCYTLTIALYELDLTLGKIVRVGTSTTKWCEYNTGYAT
jgi:hypothetical protein